jgi:hypothetical protein
MSLAFVESVVEQAALEWLADLGYAIADGREIGRGGDYGRVPLADQMRDALLPKLISGELRVLDAERIVRRRS